MGEQCALAGEDSRERLWQPEKERAAKTHGPVSKDAKKERAVAPKGKGSKAHGPVSKDAKKGKGGTTVVPGGRHSERHKAA